MENKPRLISTINKTFKPLRFKTKGKPHFQIFIKLSPDSDLNLDEIELVEYTLHPTFKNRIQKSSSRNDGFQIEIKAWGTFEVNVKVFKKDGSSITFREDMKENLEYASL